MGSESHRRARRIAQRRAAYPSLNRVSGSSMRLKPPPSQSSNSARSAEDRASGSGRRGTWRWPARVRRAPSSPKTLRSRSRYCSSSPLTVTTASAKRYTSCSDSGSSSTFAGERGLQDRRLRRRPPWRGSRRSARTGRSPRAVSRRVARRDTARPAACRGAAAAGISFVNFQNASGACSYMCRR